jgi:DNA invertase Pin-like site-specific DNA recombinase
MYLRISSDPNETASGVARQKEDGLALAASCDLAVPDHLIFIDNDLSGGSEERPRFIEMKKMIMNDARLRTIITYKIPRLSRNATDTAWLDKYGERLKLVIMETSGATYDLGDSSQSFTFGMHSLMAANQRKVTSELVKRKNRSKRDAGMPAGGRRSYGYKGNMEIIESEAKHIRWAYEALIDGESMRMITKHLNDHGAKTTTGRPWEPSWLTRLLRNPRNAGILMHNPDWQTDPKAPMVEIGRGAWVPIIDEATWHSATVILKDPARVTRAGAKQLLTGIASCGLCGAKVNGGGANHGHGAVYACTAARHLSRRAVDIDLLVENRILDRLSQPDAHDHVAPDAGDPTAELFADKRRLTADLENVFALVGTSQRSKAAAQKRISKIEADLDAIDEALARVTTHKATKPMRDLIDADDIRAHWDSLSLDVKRMIISATVTIVIKPVGRGRRSFNPDLIDITFTR